MSKYLCCLLWMATLFVLTNQYEIELESFEVYPETDKENYLDPGTVRVTQKGRNVFVISGDMQLKRNIGQHDMAKLEYHKKTLTGQYVKLFSTQMSACEMSKMSFYKTIAEHSNFPNPPECPFPKGNYKVNDLHIDESFYPKVLPLGENIIIIEIISDGAVVAGFKIQSNIKM